MYIGIYKYIMFFIYILL